MLKKINRKSFLQQYPKFVQSSIYRNKNIAPETYDSYILGVEARSTVGLCNKVSKELTKLIRLLEIDTLNFLGETSTTWLYRDHDYKPVKTGLDYLVKNKISKSFNGAIQVNRQVLPEFLKHLFWLVRCNGIIMYVHFSDPEFNIIGNICQYGNIHLSVLNEKTDVALKKALLKTQLNILTEWQCGGGKISGRTATIF